MQDTTVKERTLGRAIAIAGSAETLAGFLGLRPSDVLQWMSGRAPVPTRVFLALVDIVSANRLVREALHNLTRQGDPAWSGAERRRS